MNWGYLFLTTVFPIIYTVRVLIFSAYIILVRQNHVLHVVVVACASGIDNDYLALHGCMHAVMGVQVNMD